MFFLDKIKSFVVIYLHHNNDIIFWISKKKETASISGKILQRKSAGGIKRSSKKSIIKAKFFVCLTM